MRTLFLLSCLAALCLLACPARAKVIRVAVGQAPGPGWESALDTLDKALAASKDGDEIWVAAGTYLPSGAGRESTFRLRPGVALYGGFSGRERARDERDPKANPTILSGDLGLNGRMEDNALHVLMGADRAVLEGFTITGGFADGRGAHGRGGGLLIAFAFGPEGTMAVADCLFSDNHAREGGAAAIQGRTRTTFRKCRFTGNTAENGGAVLERDGSASVYRDCLFSRNSARWQGGAAFFDQGSAPVLAFCTLEQNAAGTHGGAVFAQCRTGQTRDTVLDMEKCRLVKNAAQGDGGAMALDGAAEARLDTCVFKENRAGLNGGAAAVAETASLKDTDCAFSGNWAEGAGDDINRGPLSLAFTGEEPRPEPPAPAEPAPPPQSQAPPPPKAEPAGQAPEPPETPAIQTGGDTGNGTGLKTEPVQETPGHTPGQAGSDPFAPPDPRRVIRRFDTNGDGRISRSEASMPMRMDWQYLDKNNDDYIDANELGLPDTVR